MAFAGGVFSLVSGNPVVTGTTISSTWANNTLSDMASNGLSLCVLKDGSQTITANIPMNSFKFTGLAAGSANGDSVRYQQFFPTFNTTGPVNETKTTVASATTPDIWTSIGNVVDYTGTVTATGFAAAPQAGSRRTLVCAGAAPFTAGANLLVQGYASGNTFTASAGDQIDVVAITTTQFRMTIRSSAGTPVVGTSLPRMYMAGLTYANNVSDATNDLDIAVGSAVDATDAYYMNLASALTKQSDAAWAVGTNAGMLDTGSVGNSDYYLWLIARSDTGVVDVLSSLSSTAPTMPSSYNFKRLIGWFKRTGGTIVAFHTYEIEGGGIELSWDAPTLDVNLVNTLTTTGRTDPVKVPLNFSTIADLNVNIADSAGTANARIYNPDVATTTMSTTATPLYNIGDGTSAATGGWIRVRTSSTGTVGAVGGAATIDNYRVVTNGFTWARRN